MFVSLHLVMNKVFLLFVLQWLGIVAVRCWACDQGVMDLPPGWVAIKWLLLGWVTICGQIDHEQPTMNNQHQGQLSLLSLRGA